MNTSVSDILLRVGAFLFIALFLWFLLPPLLLPLGMVVVSALTTLLAGLAANLASAHWFEHGSYAD
jgi:hypothetical protein